MSTAFYFAFELILALSICLFSLNGIGSLSRSFFLGVGAKSTLSQNLIIGLCATSFFIELVNLFFKIDWVVSSLLVLIGLAGNLKDSHLKKFFKLKVNLHSSIVTSIAASILLLWSLKAADPINSFDAGLYYLQSIRWLNEYPIIPGLGNLHDRLAFNQSSFGLVAALNFFPFWGKGYALINLILLAVALATLADANLKKIYGGWWIQVFVFYGLAYSALTQLSNPSPDIAVAVLEIIIFIKIFKLFLEHSDYKESIDNIDIYFLLILLFSVKLSSIAFIAFSTLLLTKSIVEIFRNNKIIFNKIIIVCIFAASTHLLRGYILSGAPLFPSKIGYISSLDWAMSDGEITNTAKWIYSWARVPGENPSQVLGNWDWFSIWYDRFKGSWSYKLTVCAGMLTFISLIILALPKNTRAKFAMYYLYAPMGFTIIFWFFTAPDIRFLGPNLILIIALSGWLIIYPTRKLNWLLASSKANIASRSFSAIACLSIAIIHPLPITLSGLSTNHTLVNAVTVKVTASGFKVITPNTDARCYDAALPCTPYFSPTLKLRNEDQSSEFLQSGFTKK
jgi:hypothetical protein